MFNFEKLEVWQRTISFADRIYRLTDAFPPGERFGLTNQLRRSAVSIASNIAEGSSRARADYARFLSIAAGSLYEVVTQATIAQRQAFMAEDELMKIRTEGEEISRMLSGLRRSLG